MAQMAFHVPALNANPARARRRGTYPKLNAVSDPDRGRQIYAHNCAGCHGDRGQGDGPGAAALHPAPANLVEHQYTLDRLAFALWNGVAGTSMPAWRDLSVQDLSAVAQAVRT